ncbi:hypothetical protein MAR_027731, partial [Mya arenaria]
TRLQVSSIFLLCQPDVYPSLYTETERDTRSHQRAHRHDTVHPFQGGKFGVNFWVLAESTTGYVISYTVSRYDCKTITPVYRVHIHVVKSLMSACHFLGRGYHVVVVSFFCSLDLAKHLMQRNTYVA